MSATRSRCGSPRGSKVFFGLPFVHASEIGVASQTIEEKCPVPTTLPMRFPGRCFPARTSRTSSPRQVWPMSHHVLPPFLGGRDAAAGFEGFWSTYADNSRVEARGQPHTDAVHNKLVAGLERSGPEVHQIPWAEGASEVLGYDLAPAFGRCSGSSKNDRPDAIGRSVRGKASSTWRQSDGARECTRVLSGAQTTWSAVNS